MNKRYCYQGYRFLFLEEYFLRSIVSYMIDRSSNITRRASADADASPVAFHLAGKHVLKCPISSLIQSDEIVSSKIIVRRVSFSGPLACLTISFHCFEKGLRQGPESRLSIEPTGRAASIANRAAFISPIVFSSDERQDSTCAIRAKSGIGSLPLARSRARRKSVATRLFSSVGNPNRDACCSSHSSS